MDKNSSVLEKNSMVSEVGCKIWKYTHDVRVVIKHWEMLVK